MLSFILIPVRNFHNGLVDWINICLEQTLSTLTLCLCALCKYLPKSILQMFMGISEYKDFGIGCSAPQNVSHKLLPVCD